MPPWLARLLMALLVAAAYGWSVYVNYKGLGDPLTTSFRVRKVTDACPQIIALILLLAFALLCDMLPNVNRWVILFCIVLPLYGLGHCMWSLP